jgi:uncharacterized protein (DUF58 family)
MMADAARPQVPHPLQRSVQARSLADRLPYLTLEARRIALTTLAGLHGRRRAGPGESFWQFRAFAQGEAAQRIDWRRSSRDDQLFVREREWEAAHTLWIWIDASPSMQFRSPAALAEKLDHAAILGLALADLLVRGGERVGLWGMGPPVSGGNVIDQLAMQWLAHHGLAEQEMPIDKPLSRHHEMVLVSDFLNPLQPWQQQIKRWGQQGGRGHLLRIIDPVEAAFPYRGQSELVSPDSDERLEIGDAGTFRSLYQARMTDHDAGLEAACTSQNWSWLKHHTDRPLPSGLLALAGRIIRSATSMPANLSAEGF